MAEGEYLVGNFYFKRGDNSAAANRLSHLVDQYPLYSKADLGAMGDGPSLWTARATASASRKATPTRRSSAIIR